MILQPCETKVVSLHFLVLGNSSLPFELILRRADPVEVIIDNLDPGFAATGTWQSSASPGSYAGESLLAAGQSDPGQAAWRPILPRAGRYEVYAWWVASPGRTPGAVYSVDHWGGTAQVSVDQRAGGSQWNSLGVYDFSEGAAQSIRLSAAAPAGADVCADAVRLLCLSPIETTVDNTDPGFSAAGAWSISANNGYYGTDSLYSLGGSGADRASWSAWLPHSGEYEVYAWWVASTNRAAAAPYVVHDRHGARTVTADQRAHTSQWNPLGGRFYFDSTAPALVQLSDAVGSSEYVSADAIRFVARSARTAPPCIADLDTDNDVDQEDLATLLACATGPGIAPRPACNAADLDADQDVDQSDFGLFQACLAGRNTAPDPDCLVR